MDGLIIRFPIFLLFFVSLTTVSFSQSSGVRIENGSAIFAGIDKITANITTFKVSINDTYIFDKLEVTPRVCYSSPPFDRPSRVSFVEISSLVRDFSTNEYDRHRIFTGWMFAESPGINGMEHPVNDVWLIGCVDPLGRQG